MFVMIILCVRKLMYFNKFILKSKCYALFCFSASHFCKGEGIVTMKFECVDYR